MARSYRAGNFLVGVIVSFLLLLASLTEIASAVAQTSSPALLVLEKSDEKLAIVDPATLKVLGRVPSGGAPHEVIASDDGKFAYISNYASQELGQLKTLSVVDLTAQKALPPVDLGALRAPHGLAFGDGKVYFTAEANKVIGRYDPATKQVDWLMGTGQNSTHMVAVSKDLKRIFTSNIGSNTICVIEQTSNPRGTDWNVTPIIVGKGPEGFDLSPDEKQIWAANSQDGSVSIVDVATKKVVETIDVKTKHSNRLKFTPDGKSALISDPEGGTLVIVDTASHKVVKTLDVGRGVEGIQLQPDGARAFVAVSVENSVAVIDLRSEE